MPIVNGIMEWTHWNEYVGHKRKNTYKKVERKTFILWLEYSFRQTIRLLLLTSWHLVLYTIHTFTIFYTCLFFLPSTWSFSADKSKKWKKKLKEKCNVENDTNAHIIQMVQQSKREKILSQAGVTLKWYPVVSSISYLH